MPCVKVRPCKTQKETKYMDLSKKKGSLILNSMNTDKK